jgi:signal transduction histidine kinase
LTVNQRTWGLLIVSSRFLRPNDAAALALFSAQVASAIEVVFSIEDLRRRNAQLETIHRLATAPTDHLGIVCEATSSDAAALYLFDEEHRLVLHGASGHEPLVTGKLARVRFEPDLAESQLVPQRLSPELWSGMTWAVLRAGGFVESASIPLRASGRLAGLLLLSRRAQQPWESDELHSAEILGNQLAAQLESVRLHSEAQHRVEQLRVLLDVGRVITGTLQLDPILGRAAQSLVQMLGATDAFVWLLEGNELVGRLATDKELDAYFRTVRLPLSKPSAVAMAIHQRAPVRIADALASVDVDPELNARFQQRSLMTIPLMIRDVPIGAIGVGDRRRCSPFTDREVEHAMLICRQLAVAVDNAQLFEDLKKSYHELGRAQQELVKRERLAALGELSAVVAHEVRNPLGVIFNSLASLRRMVPDVEEPRMLLKIVGEEAERLNRMVGDLLDFARPHEAQLHPESLSEVVTGALAAAQRAMPGHPAQLRSEVSHELSRVPMDAQMIRQALLNLVVNSVQAMPGGGTVTVRAGLELRAPGSSFARIEVEDDGPGIPAHLADRVFEPFFTTRAAGTGLGLAVVKRIADAHRAEIELRSAPGRGSNFILRLPIRPNVV